MVNDHNIVWENCLQAIRDNVSVQSFKTWFEPIKPLRLENESLTIQVPNKIFYEWLRKILVDKTHGCKTWRARTLEFVF